jgi:predicted nucleic acid-binding Zn ribbon protein
MLMPVALRFAARRRNCRDAARRSKLHAQPERGIAVVGTGWVITQSRRVITQSRTAHAEGAEAS